MTWEQRKRVMMNRIMRCQYMKMIGPPWDNISSNAKSFVQTLLQMNPSKRPLAKDALQMSWIQQYTSYMPGRILPPQDETYSQKMQLVQNALVLLSHELQDDEIVSLKGMLQEYDPGLEDSVTIQQFRDVLLQTKLSTEQVQLLF